MENVCEGKDFNFPEQEEKILGLWKELDAFKTQLKLSEGKPEYIFYDGPPFATGLPHYGHILAGTIKDIVTRFQTTNGHHVIRRFGWDCHGLPVEFEINQKLNIKSRKDVLDMGIDVYNEECRAIVMRYSKEWESVVVRMGRWIDFENDYKTLDPQFMESVWWVFKQLYDKGLVYRGFKVMPYSIGCNTALSNFEAGLNYKEVSDPSIMVTFPLLEDVDRAAMVAWTTTPWTLPSNLALCVNPKFTYVKAQCKATGAVYIVAESLLSQLPTKKGKSEASNGSIAKSSDVSVKTNNNDGNKVADKNGNLKKEKTKDANSSSYNILSRMSGLDLAGKRYQPLFEYFLELSDVAFRVLSDEYVTDVSGTGVVHCAPAFGEDDYRVCLMAGIIDSNEDLPDPVDADGCFTEKVEDFKGLHVKDADKAIIAAVKTKGRLVSAGSISHSYPFCWRSESPLIYKAVPSWFVAVEKIKDNLLKNNKLTYWVPDFVKDKRFHNWLENARDWAVSRTRFWGTPLPIWRSSDGKEIVVIGSVKELEDLSGHKVTDLHRHKIDHITIPSRRGPEFGVLKRVEDVFDCWFESGSMPYAYIHYPFENTELFEHNFPGDFVAEGLDQTRGWFYTLMVLSTALFDKPAFKNLICNGLVLAADGKKMSKKLRNYPPPMDVDALRLYLINSPVVRAESLRFKEEGVFAVVKDVFLPWYNAYRFLVQNAGRLVIEGHKPFTPLSHKDLQNSDNVLDHWINSASQSLVRFVHEEMEAYRLYTVVPYLLKFVDNLTNIYVRFNRKRLKGRTGDMDCRIALSTLFYVLLTTCKAMAPFTPFFTETLYQNIRKLLGPTAERSIHFCSFPPVEGESDERIERSVTRMMTVIDLARNIRERRNKALKIPLMEMVVVHPDEEFLDDISGKLGEYVKEELNVRGLITCNNPLKYATLRAEPDFSLLGKRLGKAMGVVAKEVKSMTQDDILNFEKSGEVVVSGHHLSAGDIKVIRDFKHPDGVNKEDIDAAGDGDVLVVLDLRQDDTLMDVGTAREIVNRVQKLRKKAGLEPTDSVEIFFRTLGSKNDGQKNNTLERIFKMQASYIQEAIGSPIFEMDMLPSDAVVLASEHFDGVANGSFQISIARPSICIVDDKLGNLCNGNFDLVEGVKVYLQSRDFGALKEELSMFNDKLRVSLDGVPEVEVTHGQHFFLSLGDLKRHT
ncbi:hypothetical protein KP509_15G036400 [Ceratopteris richardii]|uniref:isoleucine--tRNA ligase n=1 Tax=Ceratopteris richardii TaxID=49495 RepID=A0A8T2T651_CERRI|nr:hypothetical protein KP509_15G036400 [Ceratopteris richardii]